MNLQLQKLMMTNMVLENNQSWPIGDETKQFILNSTIANSIETGIGYSTILFSITSKNHTVCFPKADVQPRLKTYADQIGQKLNNVNFLVGKSQYILPTLESKIDFALIDGDHAYPAPMIDFYYINNNMIVGGTLLIDDLGIPSVRNLFDYLTMSKHWECTQLLDRKRLAVFVKHSEDKDDWHGLQGYNQKKLRDIHLPEKIKLL